MHMAFVKGQQEGLRTQLNRCMLCGKCLLVCPRGVHTRSVIMAMRKELSPEEK
jgi:heterodisulfide reductase subunit C